MNKKNLTIESPHHLEFKILQEIHKRSENNIAGFQMIDLCEKVDTTLGGVKNALNQLKRSS